MNKLPDFDRSPFKLGTIVKLHWYDIETYNIVTASHIAEVCDIIHTLDDMKMVNFEVNINIELTSVPPIKEAKIVTQNYTWMITYPDPTHKFKFHIGDQEYYLRSIHSDFNHKHDLKVELTPLFELSQWKK